MAEKNELNEFQKGWVSEAKLTGEAPNLTTVANSLLYYTVGLIATVGLFVWSFNVEAVSIPMGDIIKFSAILFAISQFFTVVLMSFSQLFWLASLKDRDTMNSLWVTEKEIASCEQDCSQTSERFGFCTAFGLRSTWT